MCGFVGLLRPSGLRPGDLAGLDAADRVQAHRGPDGRGGWQDARFAVRHRLLAIRDPAHAAQPFVGRERGTVLAYNGEVYDADALRGALGAAGATFAGHGDTEVLSAHLERHGAEGLTAVEGMYAFALYDPADGSLLLAVDANGEKPLFVSELEGGGVAFASEMRGLLATGLVARRLDPEGLSAWLATGMVPAPGTILRGVRKVPAGTWWRVSREGRLASSGSTDPLRAKDIPAAPPSFASAVAALEDAVAASVRRQLVSDRPVAVLLSGGVDSGVVAAMASRERATTTLTMGFEGSPFDETDAANAMAAHLGTDHHVLRLQSRPEGFVECLEAAMDEPIADGAIYPLHALCRAAASRATVLLCGDGGDELLLGYDGWRVDWASRARSGAPVVRGAALALSRVWPTGRRGAARLARMALPEWARARALVAPGLDAEGRFALPVSVDPGPALALLEARFPEGEVRTRAAFADAMRAWAAAVSLPAGLLVKSDRASMAASVELRVPLLDVPVRRLAHSLPLGHLVRGGRGKAALREVLARHAPAGHADRAKAGFRPPFSEWLKGPMRDAALETLAGSASPLRPFVDRDGARRLVDAHARGPAHLHQEILSLWILGWWMGRHGVSA